MHACPRVAVGNSLDLEGGLLQKSPERKRTSPGHPTTRPPAGACLPQLPLLCGVQAIRASHTSLPTGYRQGCRPGGQHPACTRPPANTVVCMEPTHMGGQAASPNRTPVPFILEHHHLNTRKPRSHLQNGSAHTHQNLATTNQGAFARPPAGRQDRGAPGNIPRQEGGGPGAVQGAAGSAALSASSRG